MENYAVYFKHTFSPKSKGSSNDFGDYKLKKVLGSGQQGVVYLATNKNGREFAIKMYCPTDEDQILLAKGMDRFKREVQILISLNHKNIVRIFEAGSADYDIKHHKWTVSNKFDNPGTIYYYVMDYIQGKSLTQMFYKKNKRNYTIDDTKFGDNQIEIYERLIRQICLAMSFVHEKNIVHRDIKSDNIFYSEFDQRFILVDFGFAKNYRKDDEGYKSFIVKKEFIDFESEDQNKVDALSDQFVFSKLLEQILYGFKDYYKPYNFEGILGCLQKAQSSRSKRYKTIAEFYKDIKSFLYTKSYSVFNLQNYNFMIPSRSFGYFEDKVRIPVSGSVPLFKEVEHLIDTPEFQRLRGVVQLGPTSYVYPGATHTRFEHSLGTYYLALRYLESLLKNNIFCKVITPMEESIKTIILSALLHDIGHYPYSHWIEELDGGLVNNMKILSHEDRAKDIIMNSNISKLIRSEWGVDPEKVCDIISKKDLDTNKDKLLRSIIDSVIDVDKIDYLQRDSNHCGVTYGFAFDVSRLISSLYVNGKENRICLTEKGRSAFGTLLMSKIAMYQEIYWHKTVRACTAMFKRFFFEYIHEFNEDNKKLKDHLLTMTDQAFALELYSKAKGTNLERLIKPFTNNGRELYKPVLVYYPGHKTYIFSDGLKKLFHKIVQLQYEEQIALSNKLVNELKIEIPDITELDVLIEATPTKSHEKSDLEGFEFYDQKLGVYEDINHEISSLNDYLESNRRVFIYCHPAFASRMKALLNSNGKEFEHSKMSKILVSLVQ